MEIKATSFEGLFILQPKLHKDQRGVFLESFRLDKLEVELGYKLNLIQDNETHQITELSVECIINCHHLHSLN